MPVVFAMSPESSKPSAKPNLSANKPLEGQALVASILAKQSTYKKTQSQNSKSLNIFKKQGGARKSEDGDEKKVIDNVAEKSRKSTS